MTTLRPALAVALSCLTLVGCDTPALCASCPPIEGTWQMLYAPFDGGIDGSPDCASVPPPVGPASIEIFRSGAILHATLNGISASGQFTESFDFTLNGTQSLGGDADNVRQVSLHGYYLPAEVADGGASLQATWTTHTEQGEKSCDADQRCTGTRR